MSNYVSVYLNSLVNKIFKILPLSGIYKDHIESKSDTLPFYLEGLLIELNGALSSFNELNNGNIIGRYIAIVNIINYINDNPHISNEVLRREIFHAISILDKITSELGG